MPIIKKLEISYNKIAGFSIGNNNHKNPVKKSKNLEKLFKSLNLAKAKKKPLKIRNLPKINIKNNILNILTFNIRLAFN